MTYMDTYGVRRDAQGRIDFSIARAARKVLRDALFLNWQEEQRSRPAKTNFPERYDNEPLQAYWRRRNAIIYRLALDGMTHRRIAERFDLSNARVWQIFQKMRRRIARSRYQMLAWPIRTLSRPIDMGGPRRVWLTFTPQSNYREMAGSS